VPAGQPDQLANAIHQLVANPQMRFSMQSGSFQLAQEKFDIEKLVLRLLDIYQTILLPG
jgi:glycosyltransferase involved in cell wall biosynthesis